MIRRIALGFVMLTAGCSLVETGPERVRHPAVLVLYHNTTTVSLPATVPAGAPARVTMTSFGGGCVTQGETELIVVGLEAEIRPYRYDRIDRSPNAACTDELRIFEHTAELRFEQPGTARIRIVGIARPGDTPYEVEREVTVTP